MMSEDRDISGREVLETLLAIGRERLTQKQKLVMITLLDNNGFSNVTAFVSVLSEEIGCSRSTMWNVMNSLKKAKLIEFGSVENKGEPVKLTKAGKVISEDLGEQNDGGVSDGIETCDT